MVKIKKKYFRQEELTEGDGAQLLYVTRPLLIQSQISLLSGSRKPCTDE